MLMRIFRLITKEFTSIFRDNLTRGQLVLMPAAMLFVFSFAITMEVRGMTLGLLNEDDGDLGAKFAREFLAGDTYSGVLTFSGQEEMTRAMDAQRALMTLHIPRDFTAKLESAGRAEVRAVLDGRKSNASQIAAAYATLTANGFASRLPGAPPVPSVELRCLFNPNLEFSWFNQPVLLLLLTQMMVLLVTGMSVAKERELGTFEQLLVSPLSPFEIVVGKTFPGVVLGFAEGGFIFIMSTRVFGVPFVGSAALLALVMFLFVLSNCAIGLAISSICSTQQQAFLGACIYTVPSMILSGFVSPVGNMPVPLRTFTLLNPMRHTLDAVMGIYLKDLSAADLTSEMTWMAGISAVMLVSAGILFKRRAI